MTNRLSNETSPYLLQHAHNPVDWYPWGSEAFERARRENRPILLSVGYSACHWCHVMERESFEDETTARLMNELFVNVKVDREERPDVDSIYMQAVQAMTGHGGWPMTVFLTPEGAPFWGGTYFPPQDRHGMPSFQRVLTAVAEAYRDRGEDVQRVAQSMRDMYASSTAVRVSGAVTPDLLERAQRVLLGAYDSRHGGFGDAPKFPQSMAMEFLLTQWARTGLADALTVARDTFLHMARGGLYDQVGGGFARYSVDERWLVPHFEKMLYDNALLLRVGTHLWQATGDDEIRRVCEETITWVEREMTAPSGGFYSAFDADSEGHEGKFYVWTLDELREALGGETDAIARYWGATAGGNFEGRNILHVATTDARPAGLDQARARLYDLRAQRVWPGRDDKILASWNGLMLRALAEAARAFDHDAARTLAQRNADYLMHAVVRDDRVLRAAREGRDGIPGFLEDHAAVALGLLAVYELTFERRWLDTAHRLCDAIVARFWDDDVNAFFDTPRDHETLITRPRDVTDNAIPSGTSLTVELLLRVGNLLGDADMLRRAGYVLETLAEPMARYPLAFGHALTAADLAVHGAVELAIIGDVGSGEFDAMARAAGRRFVPSLLVAGGDATAASEISILQDRPMRNGRATAYVCRNFTCTAPISEPAALEDALRDVLASPG